MLRCRCILSKFYIKPQLAAKRFLVLFVVSYRNSTSNHNLIGRHYPKPGVVSYRNSTSNHNRSKDDSFKTDVVSYRNSTSNHNSQSIRTLLAALYLIEILHQTTTIGFIEREMQRCILSKFYIKPQHATIASIVAFCCILSKFYIKPQRRLVQWFYQSVVSYRNSTSNHNVGPHID